MMQKPARILTVLAFVLLGLTSAARADYHEWRTIQWHEPDAPTLIWSDPLNWWISGNGTGVPAAGDQVRFELSVADAAKGPIVLDVDYSGGGLQYVRFTGKETVYIRNYLKVTSTTTALQIQNGGFGGAYVRVDSGGTIWGTINCANEGIRTPPTLDFAGGDWVAGNLKTEAGNRQGGIIKVSSRSSTITPGYISVSLAPEPVATRPRFHFALDSFGVAPIILTDADPLQFTGDAAGTNPFRLSVDMSAYRGSAVSIALFIFSGSSTETDRLFAPGNITISNEPETGSPWFVEQSFSGVTLTTTGAPPTLPGMLLYVK